MKRSIAQTLSTFVAMSCIALAATAQEPSVAQQVSPAGASAAKAAPVAAPAESVKSDKITVKHGRKHAKKASVKASSTEVKK